MSDTFRALRLSTNDDGPNHELVEMTDADLMDGDVTVSVSHSTVNYKDGLALSGAPAVARIANRRVHLGMRAQLFIGLRCRQCEVLGRHFDTANVPIGGQNKHFFFCGDVQHMDLFTRFAGHFDQTSGA